MKPLDQIKQIDIRELNPLEVRGGKVQQGKCPFPDHDQVAGKAQTGKTGAFTYYSDTNTCFCWSCRRGGSAIDFWALLHGRDFSWALRDLADRKGIKLKDFTPEEEAQIVGERRREEALAFAASFYENQLHQAGPVLEYCQKRGWSIETIKALRLGYANKQLAAAVKGDKGLADKGLSLDDFMMYVDEDGRELPKTSKFSAKLIVQTPDGRVYDFFRDRLIFPVMKHGRVVHMSGRDLSGKEGVAKYMNARFQASALYLEDRIRNDLTMVFEGLPDTASAFQWDLPACGNQGTHGVARLAHRFRKCRKVVVFFDMDGPGRKAAIDTAKAIHMAMEAGEVAIGSYPAGFKDANELLAAGYTAEQVRKLADEAKPLIDTLIADLDAEASPHQLEEATNELFRLVGHLGVFHHEAILKKIQTRLKVPIATVRDAFKRSVAEAVAKGPTGEGADEPGVDFSSGVEIVPAQDFRIADGEARGNVAIFLQVTRQIDDGGETRKIKRWEPMLVTAKHSGGKLAIKLDRLLDLPLSPAERRRIPFENTVKGRWRVEGKHPFSVESFVKGKVQTVDGPGLYSDILSLLRRYIWLPNPVDHEVVATWIMMTYVYRVFHAIGYIHLHGVRESGKTNMAFLIEELAFNAKQSAGQSESVMFRSVEANCRTMLLDEAERLNSPDPKSPMFALMGIANAGYKKGACVERSEPDPVTKTFTPQAFDVYCPKVFISIAELFYVLASRCITIPCLRATADELAKSGIRDLAQNVHREQETFASIRDRLHCWALLTFPKLADQYSDKLLESKALTHLRGREREMWLPLLSVAAVLDEESMADASIEEKRAAILNGDLLSIRLLEAQKAKESNRRMVESDQAFEVVALTLLHEAIMAGEISPARMGEGGGDWFVMKDLADLMTLELRDTGLLGGDRTMSVQRLVNLLTKTKAIEASERDRIRLGTRVVRVVHIRKRALEESIVRLGGKINPPAGSFTVAPDESEALEDMT